MPYPARAILAIDTSPFGESLEVLPAMRALRLSYAKSLIVAAAPAATVELVKTMGLVDDTIDLGVIKASDGKRSGVLRRAARLARHARKYQFDLVLDFSPGPDTQIVSRLMVRARTLAPSSALEMLMDFAGLPKRSPGSDSSYAKVMGAAGVELSESRLGVSPSPADDARFEELLARAGFRGGEPIAIVFAANAGDPRGWPVQSFGEIGARLANNFSARIVAADEPFDDTFTEAIGPFLSANAIKLAEPDALELLAALARASIVITDAPSIANLASEAGTPVIEVADGRSTRDSRSSTHRVIYGSSRSQVSTDEVFELASQMIQSSRTSSLFQRL